jgi:hypothetical protein
MSAFGRWGPPDPPDRSSPMDDAAGGTAVDVRLWEEIPEWIANVSRSPVRISLAMRLIRHLHVRLRRARHRRVIESLEIAFESIWVALLTMCPAVAMVLTHKAAVRWPAGVLLAALCCVAEVQNRRQIHRQLASEDREVDARADELVCQLMISRPAGLRKLGPCLWSVTPIANPSRQLHVFGLSWHTDDEPLVDLGPTGAICLGIPAPPRSTDHGIHDLRAQLAASRDRASP